MTARYGIKHGYLRKKNEQGTFHRRYCVLVPHLFLYYYENETSDTPRGIIDLDFYTDTVEDGGVRAAFLLLCVCVSRRSVSLSFAFSH